MNVDLLAKMLGELVLNNSEVGLPGLGTFVVEMVPASFSDRGYTINPPYKRLSFHPGRGEDSLLIDMYAASNKIDRQAAGVFISNFLSELRDVLRTRKTVVLPGLGRLRATKENNFFFVCDENLDIYPEGFGLEPISLKTHTETQSEISHVVSTLASIVTGEAVEAAPSVPETVTADVEAVPDVQSAAVLESSGPEAGPAVPDVQAATAASASDSGVQAVAGAGMVAAGVQSDADSAVAPEVQEVAVPADGAVIPEIQEVAVLADAETVSGAQAVASAGKVDAGVQAAAVLESSGPEAGPAVPGGQDATAAADAECSASGGADCGGFSPDRDSEEQPIIVLAAAPAAATPETTAPTTTAPAAAEIPAETPAPTAAAPEEPSAVPVAAESSVATSAPTAAAPAAATPETTAPTTAAPAAAETPAATPAPTAAHTAAETPAPAKSRTLRTLLIILLTIVIVLAVCTAVFLILSKVTPDFIDSILYTPEELRILNY